MLSRESRRMKKCLWPYYGRKGNASAVLLIFMLW